MINGTSFVGRVVEESVCRSSKNYRFTDVGIYAIHSNALMPNIPFGAAAVTHKEIDDTIFINDEETHIILNKQIDCQNFISARYTGKVPLEYYQDGHYTKMGRQFLLVCRHGIPNSGFRTFSSSSNLEGYDQYTGTTYPDGGEDYSGSGAVVDSSSSFQSTPSADIDAYAGGGKPDYTAEACAKAAEMGLIPGTAAHFHFIDNYVYNMEYFGDA